MLMMPGLMGAYLGLNQCECVSGGQREAFGSELEINVIMAGGLWSFGHLLGMIAFLLPLAVVVGICAGGKGGAQFLNGLHVVLSTALVAFALYKLWKPRRQLILPYENERDYIVRSFVMTVSHCGSPIMMAPMLVMIYGGHHFLSASPASDWRKMGVAAILAVVIAGAMATTLFLTLVIFGVLDRGSGARVSRIARRLNLEFGWTLMFLVMGGAGLLAAF